MMSASLCLSVQSQYNTLVYPLKGFSKSLLFFVFFIWKVLLFDIYHIEYAIVVCFAKSFYEHVFFHFQ